MTQSARSLALKRIADENQYTGEMMNEIFEVVSDVLIPRNFTPLSVDEVLAVVKLRAS